MTLRQTLRTRTDDLHETLDALLGRFDLGRREEYREFLIIHARVLPPIEQALEQGGIAALLPDWPEHRRTPLLERDLSALGGTLPEPMAVGPLLGMPGLLGTAYVIEGSRLGSRFLAKRVGNAMPAEYLNAAGQQKAWPALLSALDGAELGEMDVEQAAHSARRCFELFINAASEAPFDG